MTGREGERSRVLLVDDEESIRRDYGRALESSGYRVDLAGGGAEALEAVRRESYAAVVSDIGMPGFDGVELLRRVRELDLAVPVVLITGAPGMESAIRALEYGASGYLIKPVGVQALSDSVRRAIGMSRLASLRQRACELSGAEPQLGDRAALDARFERGLAGLYMAYQPIVSFGQREVFGYEALMRSREASLPNPPALMDAAERLGRGHELGRRVRALVAEQAESAPENVTFFVNVNAEELNDDELLSSSSPLSRIASRVTVEVTERSALQRVSGLAARVARMRRLGYRIALDDLGAGYAGLSSFSLLEPEFVKLDMSLVRGIDVDSRKRSIVRSITQLCATELGVQVVAEGVESVAERDTLLGCGIDLLQGYLLAKPAPSFQVPNF